MKKTKHINIYLIILAFIAVATVTLRTIECFTSFNPVTMHFDNKLIITIANVLVVLGIATFSTYLFAGPKNLHLIPSSETEATYIPTGLVAVALMFFAMDKLHLLRSDIYKNDNVIKYLLIALIAFAFLSLPAFLLLLLNGKNQTTIKVLFSLCIVLYLTVYSVYLYFNKSIHPTNSPNKIVDQMAYLFSAMFFLFETRIPLGRALWRPYVAFGLAASLLTAYSAIPSLLVYFINKNTLSDSPTETAVTLALCAFITSRVILTEKLTEDIECPEAEVISVLADARKKEIKERNEALRAHVNKNNEENDTVDAENYQFDIPDATPSAKENEE